MRQLFLILLLSSLAAALQAQVYKHVDEEGNVTFTDQPPPDSTPVEINETNTAPPPSRSAYPAPPPSAEPAASGGDYKVSITSPANETIIPRGPGNFSVSASVTPKPRSGHKLQLLIDGTPHEAALTGTNWALTNIFRGERRLEVSVVDSKGKQLAKSEPVVVFVFRPSTNNRNRPTNLPARPRPTPN